jgi:hypothetical protein
MMILNLPNLGSSGRVPILARRLGLGLALASPEDLPAIDSIVSTCFPDLPPSPRHLTTGAWDVPGGFVGDRRDARRLVVAVGPGGSAVAYAEYILYRGCDVYLKEIAAIPHGAGRVPGAATALVGIMLEEAIEVGCRGRATLNVVPGLRVPSGISAAGATRRDPIGFYRRCGYLVNEDAVGYTSSGAARDWCDIWMDASILEAFDRVREDLISHYRAPSGREKSLRSPRDCPGPEALAIGATARGGAPEIRHS